MSTSNTLLLNQSELAYLMKLWGARNVVGLSSRPPKSSQSAKTVQSSLKNKQVILNGTDQSSVNNKYRPWLDALFAPQRALVIVRDLPKVGKQLLIFSSHDETIILHSLPQEGEHRLAEMTVKEIDGLFDAWFPATENPNLAPGVINLSSRDVNQSRELVESGQKDAAIKILQELNLPTDLINDWVNAVASRKYSASFATLNIRQGELEEVNSFSILAGERSQWIILQGFQGEESLSLIRSNNAPKNKIRFAIQLLTETAGKQFISYSLRKESLAFCFASLNRSDLGYKLIQTMSKNELSADQLQIAMKQGAERLANIGLCDFSPKGVPSLLPTLENAVFPLAKFDYVIQTSIVRQSINADATLYVQRGKAFTSHILSQGMHILEHGKIDYLDSYIGKLFGDFAFNAKSNPSWDFSISISILRPFLIHPESTTLDNIERAGVQKNAAAAIINDLNNQTFRASLTRINVSNDTDQKTASELTKPILILLEGRDNSWMFDFPGSDDKSIGKVQCIDRNKFETFLKSFVS